VITSAGTASFLTWVAGSFSMTTTGFPVPALHETGALPAGLTFHDNGNGTATLAGTPTAAGTTTVSLSASNGVGAGARQTLSIAVAAVPPLSLTVTTTSLPAGSVYSKTHKVTYSATLTAASGNAPYKWSLAPGSALPPGLKLKSTGVISGKAKVAGTFSFTIKVIDTKTKAKPRIQHTATAILSITVS
jgi:hypothetical protein